MDRVKGKVALVSGSASGIGRETAILLAKEGASVIVSDINVAGGREVARQIRKERGKATFIKLDVTIERDWIKAMEKIVARFGRLDVLVNNAGTMILKAIENMTLDEWRFQLGANLEGVFLGTKHAVGVMKNNGGGSIVNISSTAGLVGTLKDGSAYCASKAGVRMLTKAAALECSTKGYNYNIRVNSVHPGGTRTPLTMSLLQDEGVRKASESSFLTGHMGETIDIANAVLYLASEESKFATGSELVVDGGCTAI